MAIPVAYTTREDMPGVIFLCDQSSYRVQIAERPMPMCTVITVAADQWTEFDAIAPLGRKPAANLFNAVIKGQKAEYALHRRKTRLPLHLPPVDESFRDFASACKALQ